MYAREKLSLKFHTLGALVMCFICAYVFRVRCVCERVSLFIFYFKESPLTIDFVFVVIGHLFL